MIFIDNALREIGPDCLLINLKAHEFYHGVNLQMEDYETLEKVLISYNEVWSISDIMKDNLYLIVLYHEIAANKRNAQEIYINQYKNVPLNNQKQGTEIEKMHYWFNIIELEYKYRQRNNAELEGLLKELAKMKGSAKNIEDLILLKYYNGLLSFLKRDYVNAKESAFTIILEIDEKTHDYLPKSNLMKYIELKNLIVMIKTLEMESEVNNRKEIVANLECLFEIAKAQKVDFAIIIGIKMYTIQAFNVDYYACVQILEELQNLLHTQMVLGKSQANFLEYYVFINALFGYYQKLLGNTEQVKRSIRKLSNSLKHIQENNEKNNNRNNQNTICQYSFFNLVMKRNENILVDKDEQNRIIQQFKLFLDVSIKNRNDVILNIYAMNNNDIIAKSYFEKEHDYRGKLTNQESFNSEQLLLAFLYLYNSISALTKSHISDNNVKQRNKYRINIKQYCEIALNYIIEGIKRNDVNLKALLQYNYFKELFNNIYYIKAYTLLIETNYKEVITTVDHYMNCLKFQFELGMTKGYCKILQTKGDAYMKMANYSSALSIYTTIIDHSHQLPLISFNTGICHLMMNNIKKGKEFLSYSKQYFTDNNEKIKLIDGLLNKI